MSSNNSWSTWSLATKLTVSLSLCLAAVVVITLNVFR
jgi:hypothetical protein